MEEKATEEKDPIEKVTEEQVAEVCAAIIVCCQICKGQIREEDAQLAFNNIMAEWRRRKEIKKRFPLYYSIPES